MVLEGSTSDDAFPSDQAPPSDSDAFDQSANAVHTPKHILDLADLPQPLFQTLPPRFGDALLASLGRVATVMERPLRPEEIDALAFHMAKGFQYASFGPPAGVALACVNLYRARNLEFSILGWKPFKEGSRLSMDKFGPLSGDMARSAWRGIRFGATSSVYVVLSSIFFQMYGLSTATVGRTLDPRLKDFTQVMMQQQKEKRGLPKTYDSPGQQASETFEQASQRRGIQQRSGQSPSQSDPVYARPSAPVDDASPTGGSFQEEYMNSSNAEPAGSGSRWEQVQASASRTQQSGNQQATGSGSAWDRLRQNAMSNPGPSAQQQRPTGPISRPDTDRFAYDDAERDRQLAKSEAQQDFDRRIQQEREGKDFSESQSRRWS